MPIEELRALKQGLLDEYEHFADKRIKKLDSGDRFIVDGRTRNDIAADGQVYGWFCSMFLDVLSDDELLLTLINSPVNDYVNRWYSANAVAFGRNGQSVSILRGKQRDLLELEGRIGAITLAGVRYDVPHYKYAVPRVTESLRRLRTTLDNAWPVAR